jgi:putative heme-binding domain-containing protein
MSAMRRLGSALALIVVIVAALSGQHNFTPAEVENGARLYQGTCAGCHGTAGDQVPGTALRSGTFRRGTTDDEIVRIIRTGVPGTAMPPNAVSETEAAMIVAWLRGAATGAAASGPAGDAARGKAVFEGKGNCQSCHGPAGAGGRRAPALLDVGVIRRPPELERSLLDPAADIHPDFRSVTATTKAGATVTGRLLNQNSYSIQLLDSRDQLRSLDKSGLRDHAILATSPMPSYRQTLTAQELADVVAFLGTRRGSR